jgi:ribosomal protein S18 acetylase RimI-like enzyme
MFATATLAKRIERAEAGLILEGARAAARRVPADRLLIVEANGGVGTFVEPGSPFNKVAGLGFDGVPATEFFDTLERDFADRQAPLQFEVSSLADPDVVQTLTRRGYRLVGFENVLGLRVHARMAQSLAEGPGEVTVGTASVAEASTWIDTVVTGFLHPDVFDGPPSHESISRDVLDRIFSDTVAAPGFERFLARRGDVVAGGASFRLQEGVAQLNGAATLPAHRRQGVQTALLRHRLAEAARRDADVAVVTTQPGSKSQENVQRAGFSLLYVRAILIKDSAAGG